MRVVLDTNCFLVTLPKKSNYRPIFNAFRLGKFELAVSTEILEEYGEIFAQKMTPKISQNVIELILKQRNTIETNVYYRWNLITSDKDDDKFVDTTISSNADFLVTNDKHFTSYSIP